MVRAVSREIAIVRLDWKGAAEKGRQITALVDYMNREAKTQEIPLSCAGPTGTAWFDGRKYRSTNEHSA